MNPFEGIVLKRVLSKIAVSSANAGAALLCAHLSGHYGVTINQAELAAAFMAALEAIRHYLVERFPQKLAWLSAVALALAFASPSALAQTAAPAEVNSVSFAGFDLGSFISAAQATYGLDQHLDQIAGAYVSALNFHTASGLSIASLDVGAAWESKGPLAGVGGPSAFIPFRLDNLAGLWTSGAWAKTHETLGLKLPNVSFGPMGGYVNKLGWLYGVQAAVKFGGSAK